MKVNVAVGMGLIVWTVGTAVWAQELLPELAAPAARHKAAVEALDKQRLEAVALAAKPYVSALDAVEKAATTAGQFDAVKAVGKEREEVGAGTLGSELPTALPKKLQSARKALLAALERVNADFARRKKQADIDYLHFLGTLQPKAAANPELAKQLAAEKAAVLEGGAAGAGAKTTKKANPKNLVVNGDFEKVVDGKPEGWKGLEWVTAEKEDNNTFVRFVQAVNNDGTVNRKACEQDVEVPKGAKTLTFAARIRTKNCVPPKNAGGPSIWITYISQQGKGLSQISQTWGGKNGSWKTIQNEGPVPKDAAIAHVALINGRCPGQIDFDDIEVTFK